MQNDCAFCDRSKFEERIVGEGHGFWIIATLGQISRDGGYVLVVPKKHVPCIGALEEELTSKFFRITQYVSRVIAVEYQRWDEKIYPQPVTHFEHGVVGQTVKHAHLHILPTVIDMTQKIRADFPNNEIEEFRDGMSLQKLYGERREPYLWWTTPSGKAMICWNPPAPDMYLRIVAAELLGCPERANWRTMDQELDQRLWSETVTRLKPYFK